MKKKNNYSSNVALILACVPALLLVFAGIRTLLGVDVLFFLPTLMTGWSLSARLIFFNVTFLLFPVAAIILCWRNFKQNRNFNRVVIALALLVLIWFTAHAIFG